MKSIRCEHVRFLATKDCHSERPDGRMYRGARWRGLFSLILYLMWQEVEQKGELTEESQTVDRLYPESEGETNSCTA